MLAFEGLTVNESRGELTLKDFEHVQRISLVKELDEFIGDFENQFSLHANFNFDSPKLGVFDDKCLETLLPSQPPSVGPVTRLFQPPRLLCFPLCISSAFRPAFSHQVSLSLLSRTLYHKFRSPLL
jgi:hypothetical protein